MAHARDSETAEYEAAPGPAVDLVLPTVDRTDEPAELLDSLVAQTYRHFRVLVVDQNEDGRLGPVLEAYRDRLRLVRIQAERGASRARNAGIEQLHGDVVGFPDDDCAYPPDLLERVVRVLQNRPEWDGVAGVTHDRAGRSSFVGWERERGLVSRENVWRTAVAVTIFLRREVVEAVGGFDESLGVGSGTVWGSGEETDYVLRALDAGFTLGYEPGLSVLHDSPEPKFGRAAARKGYLYGMGNSRVLRQHDYGWRFASYRALHVLGGATFFLARGRPGRAAFYAAMGAGRIRGWLGSRPGESKR